MEQYRFYLDPITQTLYRDGVRNGWFVIDKALTATGFNGIESEDGITGDWFCLKMYDWE